MERSRITVFDTTLRDGEQSPGCSMNLDEKLRMARQLDRLGVDVIEAGFPIASQGDFEAVEVIAQEIRRPIIAGLARATHHDIERAWGAVRHAARPRIHVFLATSDIHLHYKLKMNRDQCIRQAVEQIQFAHSLCADVEFSPEDATRTELEFLCSVVEAVVEARRNHRQYSRYRRLHRSQRDAQHHPGCHLAHQRLQPQSRRLRALP